MDARHALELLERFDEGRAVFGAAQHGYERAKAHSEKTVAAFEKRAGVKVPDEFRTFLREQWSSGAGPYYGIMKLPEKPSAAIARDFDPHVAPNASLTGAIPLADQGCAMASVLVVSGPHRGEVWSDRRENGGGLAFESTSFDTWIVEWLDRSLIEASRALFPVHVSAPGWESHPLLDAAADAIERYTNESRKPTPSDEQYPFDATDTLAYLRIYQSRFDEAIAVFERLRDRKDDDFEPRFHLRCAHVHRAKGDAARWLEESRAGLESEGAWFATRASLLAGASEACFALERTKDAIEYCEQLAKHTGEVQEHLMVAWHRVMANEPERAAKWIVAAATEGVGCDVKQSMAKRVDALVRHGFLDALGEETPAGAKALEKALAKQLARN